MNDLLLYSSIPVGWLALGMASVRMAVATDWLNAKAILEPPIIEIEKHDLCGRGCVKVGTKLDYGPRIAATAILLTGPIVLSFFIGMIALMAAAIGLWECLMVLLRLTLVKETKQQRIEREKKEYEKLLKNIEEKAKKYNLPMPTIEKC